MTLPILLDESSEVLLLTCQTIKKDLDSSNQYIVSCALIAIAEICNADMCRDMCPEVIKLIKDSNPFIKKRVALALLKIAKVCPNLIDTFSDKLDTYFTEKNNGVLICGLELIIYIFNVNSKLIKKYRKYLNNLIKFIKELISVSYLPEYEVNGVIDPFLQAKIIEVFKFFGQDNLSSCSEISDILANVSN
jgi:AP-1 complex subunit gamma-1